MVVDFAYFKNTLKYVNKDSMEFNGVIYGGFFKTKKGIKVISNNYYL